jgi:primosomal protein N' (replication factor Y)
MTARVEVVVPTPVHSSLGAALSYRSELPLAAGALVRVPLGRREVCGVVWDAPGDTGPVLTDELKPVIGPLAGLPPLSPRWRQLVGFAAGYYQRSLGEVALAALPPQLRELDAVQLARRLKRAAPAAAAPAAAARPALTGEQEQALAAMDAEAGPFLLFGATGSGKTEVYLRAVESLLQRAPQAQALVLVPEINLTPQLQARFEERFGAGAVVPLHSGMTNPQRLRSWLAAHLGSARIVLGTRMAVFA